MSRASPRPRCSTSIPTRAWTAARAFSACPVGAIAADTKLTEKQLPFIELNAAFYPKREGKLPPTSKLAPVIAAPTDRPRGSADR